MVYIDYHSEYGQIYSVSQPHKYFDVAHIVHHHTIQDCATLFTTTHCVLIFFFFLSFQVVGEVSNGSY